MHSIGGLPKRPPACASFLQGCLVPARKSTVAPHHLQQSAPTLQKVGWNLGLQLGGAVQTADLDAQRGEGPTPLPTLLRPGCLLRQRLACLVIVAGL